MRNRGSLWILVGVLSLGIALIGCKQQKQHGGTAQKGQGGQVKKEHGGTTTR